MLEELNTVLILLGRKSHPKNGMTAEFGRVTHNNKINVKEVSILH